MRYKTEILSPFPLGKRLALLAGTAAVVLLAFRIRIAFWEGGLSFWWIEDTILTAALLLATAAGCGWLAVRALRCDREQALLEKRAEISLLAGGLAHEIRNTLNAMHSQIALLRKQLSPQNEAASGRIAQVERAVAEMEGFVNEFLAFARPAKDQLEEVDLAELIRGLLDFMALDLEQGKVTAVVELDPDLPPVYVDAGKLKRAVLNLLINARQAMPEGGTLVVRAKKGEAGQVVVEVQDSGCGIPEEDRPRIFQTFFSTKPDGAGLGLAVVKRTVEDCGGRVTFVSEVGHGTTFRISLPVSQHRRGKLNPKMAAKRTS